MPVRWIALLLCAVLVTACRAEDAAKVSTTSSTATSVSAAAVPTSEATPAPTAVSSPAATARPTPVWKLSLVPVTMRVEPSTQAGWQFMLLTLAVRNDGTEPMAIEFPDSRTSLAVAEGRSYEGNLATEVRVNYAVVAITRNEFKDFLLAPTFSVCSRNGHAIWAVSRIPVGTTPATLHVPGFDPVDLQGVARDGSCPTSAIERASTTKFAPMPLYLSPGGKVGLNVYVTSRNTPTDKATILHFVMLNPDRFANTTVKFAVQALDTQGGVWSQVFGTDSEQCRSLDFTGQVGPSQIRPFNICFPLRNYVMFSAKVGDSDYLFTGSPLAPPPAPHTLDTQQVVSQLLSASFNTALLPPGARYSGVSQLALSETNKRNKVVGHVSIDFDSANTSDAMGYEVFATAKDASDWFAEHGGVDMAISGVSYAVRCFTAKDAQSPGVAFCNVLIGNVVAYGIAGHERPEGPIGALRLAMDLAGAAVQHFDTLR